MLRDVALGSGEARRRLGLWRQSGRVGASGAELGRWRQLTAAVHTCQRERRGALLAEVRAVLVLVLTPPTLHRENYPPFCLRRHLNLAYRDAATVKPDRQCA